jgi:hypothetical protein
MKFKHYWKPTPVFWRKVGDSLLAASSFITTYALFSEMKWVAFTSLGIGVAGKFLTNFFKKEEEPV